MSDVERTMGTRLRRASSRTTIALCCALWLGACGKASTATDSPGSSEPSPSSVAEATSAPAPAAAATRDTSDTSDTSATSVTSSTGASSTASLQPCSEVPAPTTAVIGTDTTLAGPDPVFQGVLLAYTQEHADTFGGMWIDREASGTIVLAFTDDPEPHRAALAQRRPSTDDPHPVDPMPAITDDRPIGEWGVAFDVVQVAHTEAELLASSNAVMTALIDAGIAGFGAGTDIMRNRVMLVPPQSPTDEEATDLSAVIESVVPLDSVCLEGTIVDARPAPIAPGTPLDVIVLPDPDGTYPPDTVVECGAVQFTLGDLQSPTPIEQADPGLRGVVHGWLTGAGAMGWPSDGWVVLTQDAARATIVRITDGAMSTIEAEMGRNGWVWAGASGGGPCDVSRRLPNGMGDVQWILDPAYPAPDPTTTEVHVLATEQACTGASPLGDRLLGPQLVETDDAVRIAFAAIPLIGEQTCPGNPATPVTIALDRPLGDRALLDGREVGPLADLLAGAA